MVALEVGGFGSDDFELGIAAVGPSDCPRFLRIRTGIRPAPRDQVLVRDTRGVLWVVSWTSSIRKAEVLGVVVGEIIEG